MYSPYPRVIARTWIDLFKSGGKPPRTRQSWLSFVRKRMTTIFRSLLGWKPMEEGHSKDMEDHRAFVMKMFSIMSTYYADKVEYSQTGTGCWRHLFDPAYLWIFEEVYGPELMQEFIHDEWDRCLVHAARIYHPDLPAMAIFPWQYQEYGIVEFMGRNAPPPRVFVAPTNLSTKEADMYRIWCVITHTRPAFNIQAYIVGNESESNLPMVRMPRGNLTGVRIALQKRASKGGNAPGEESSEILEGARIAGPLLSKASTGYSPFVTPDINLMVAKELTEDSEGFRRYVWDADGKDFVEWKESAAASKPDDETSMGDAPADSEDPGRDTNTNPWINRAAKRHKQGAEVLVDAVGDMSSYSAMAVEYAKADPIKAAQMVPTTGGRARSPSLFAGSGNKKGKTSERLSRLVAKPVTAGSAAMREPSRDCAEQRTLSRGDTVSSVLADIEAKYEVVDARQIQEEGWYREDQDAVAAQDRYYSELYEAYMQDSKNNSGRMLCDLHLSSTSKWIEIMEGCPWEVSRSMVANISKSPGYPNIVVPLRGKWVVAYTIARTPEMGLQATKNTIGGRIFGWLQRAVVSLDELFGTKMSYSLDTLVNGNFEQLLEGYRQMVREAKMPCMIPAGYFAHRPSDAPGSHGASLR